MIGLQHYLIVGCILFLSGMWAVTTRRNAVWILMGIELILNGASLNFVAFSRFVRPAAGGAAEGGMVASAFIIILAAAEAAVALALIVAMYRSHASIQTDTLNELKG